MFGNKAIIAILLIVVVIGLLAYIGASFELNFAITAIMAIGLGMTGFFMVSQDVVTGIVILFTALIMSFFFSRILGG